MRLLLINDDGYEAHGLNAMANKLSLKHHVTVVAPLHEYSACSHQITINRKIPVKTIQNMPFDIYAVDGTPADCARFGLLGLSKSFDLVITGINHGWNLGLDLYYSGTFSAAAEAALLGTKAIACSASHRQPSAQLDYLSIVNWLDDFIERGALSLFQTTHASVLNVNFPYPLNPNPESKLCTLATVHYDHIFQKDEQGFECTLKIHDASSEPESDFAAHLKGVISITVHNPHEGRR
jgi:5'-nucleotidase